ncbi:phenylacetate--CoA ligase family protein [Sorangium sp. So ce388]|uniref:phenylacetate--CoA ligase family protein n=1 Tax=Sorangium sp. So ce388 TaxID=3133309 RepID=UPI003F5BBD5E
MTIPDVITRHLSGAESADSLSPDTLSRYCDESLRAILRRAYDRAPFYRAKLDQAGIAPDDIRGRSDLARLPFLTKDELRGQPFRLLACEKKDIALIQVSTGTTGGEDIYMAYTWNDYLLHDLAPRYSRLFPVGPGDICLNALPYEMSTAGLAFHKTFMDGYGATVIPAGKGGAYSTPLKTVKVMRDLRPNVVVTSPSWAIMLAEEAARSSLDLTSLRLKKMWLTGEGCSPAFRRRVEELWGTTANFFYGSLECGALGIECDRHDGYHVPLAHVLMEIVDPESGRSLGPGETGEIVVTGLLRYDSPILRFRTGDLGSLEAAPCACGVAMPRFRMKGRVHDQIRFRGKVLSPIYLEEHLLRMPEVGNWFQFVMPASDQARIKVRCELSRGVAPDAALAEALATRMQAATALPFDFEFLHPFPRTGQKAARVVRD